MTVRQLVDRERRRVRVLDLVAGAALGVGVAALLLAVGTMALGEARWLELSPIAPVLIWVALIAGVTGIVLWTRRRLTNDAARERVATAIEREQALRDGALRGALEVEDSGVLGRRAAEQLTSRLAAPARRDPLAPALRRGARRRAIVAGQGALLGGFALFAATAAAGDGLAAILMPMSAWRGTLLEPIRFGDLPPEVLRGEHVRIALQAPGRTRVTLHHRATGQAWRASRLIVRGDGEAGTELGPIDADLMLVATDGRARSDTVTIRVTDRPFIGHVVLRATYPPYLERGAEALPVGEPLRLPRGTVLDIGGRASAALERVRLAGRADTAAMAVDGHAFTGRLVPRESGSWAWLAAGREMPINDVPPPLEIEIIPDSAPQVEIVAPASDTVVAADDRLAFRISASDDHGLAEVGLRSWRVETTGKAHGAIMQRLASAEPQLWSGVALLELAPRELLPGDALHIVAVATDASPWAQEGRSRELVVRIPSLAERREMARALGDSAVSAVSRAAADQRQLERRTGDAARSRSDRSEREGSRSNASSGESEVSYEQAERARSLAREQRDLVERVERAREAAAALEEQLRRAGALDEDLAERLREAQQMLAEALTPELMQQLSELEQSLQRMSPDEARRSLAELAEQQRRLREQLERSAEMLKRAALEGAMETLRDEARELADRERALADSLRAGQPPNERAAKELGERSSDLARDAAALAERLQRESAETGARRSREASQQANASAQAMQETARHAAGQQATAGAQQKAPPQSAQQAAEEGAQAMERAAQALQEARAQQVEEWKEELTGELDRAIQEMVQMAREQQALEQKAGDGAEPAELRPQQSALQQGIETTSQRLDAASRKSTLISARSRESVAQARQQVAQANEATAEARQGRQAAPEMRDAAEALNQAAAALVRDRERIANAKSASGFQEMIEQLQQLAKQQGQLNAQASGMMQLPVGAPGESAQEGARGLARQQRELARRIEDVGDLEGGARAEELAREARRIADALESGRLDAQTLARQQELFQRLLDAGRTLEQDERDDTGKREATSATDPERFLPAGARATGREARAFREPTWEELRGLSPEERRSVLEYFRRINASQP